MNWLMQQMDDERTIDDAIRHHMANTQWDGRTNWGPWFLEEKNGALAFMYAEGGILKRHYYDVPLNRILAVYGHDADTIQSWSHQLRPKAWTTLDDVLQLVEALCSLYKAGKCGEQVTG